MQEYLKDKYDFFYMRKDESEFPLNHLICLNVKDKTIKGTIIAIVPFNKIITFNNVFQFNNKEIVQYLKFAQADDKIAQKVIDYIEENQDWKKIYDKCKNTKKRDKHISIEER